MARVSKNGTSSAEHGAANRHRKVVSLAGFQAGGRRTKFTRDARVVGNADSIPEYRGRFGRVVDYLGNSQYRIEFDDTHQQEFVLSQWLDLAESLA